MELRPPADALAAPAQGSEPWRLAKARAIPHELVSIQLLRAVAALAVAFWHLVWVSRAFPAGAPSPPGFLAFGYAGVDLFFVISGFIICYITSGRPFSARRFGSRRFLRIVPLYALFTSLAVLAAFVNPAWDGNRELTLGYVLRSFLIVPMREGPYLGPGWSLEHELIFYLLAGALLARGAGRRLPHALAGLFAVGVGLHVWLPARGQASPWDFHLFSLYHFQFLVGVLAFRHRQRLAALGWRLPGLAGTAGFLLVSQLVASHHMGGMQGVAGATLHVPTQPAGLIGLARVVGYGLAAGLLLVALLNAERGGALAPARAGTRGVLRALAWIGEASFALYLSHYFVYSIAAKLYAALGVPDALAVPALAAALLAAVGFALAFHLSVERPFLAWARRRL